MQHWRFLEIFPEMLNLQIVPMTSLGQLKCFDVCKMLPVAWCVSLSMWCLQDLFYHFHLDGPIWLARIMFQLGWITYQLYSWLGTGFGIPGRPRRVWHHFEFGRTIFQVRPHQAQNNGRSSRKRGRNQPQNWSCQAIPGSNRNITPHPIGQRMQK